MDMVINANGLRESLKPNGETIKYLQVPNYFSKKVNVDIEHSIKKEEKEKD